MSSWLEQLGELVAPSPEKKNARRKSIDAASAYLSESLVDCSRVFVKEDSYGGAGAFAARNIQKGELVEKGIVRRLTNVDGNENPYVFTWSDTVPCSTWAIGSGCSTFYNTAEENKANTHMKRFFDENRFEIYATKDINAGEELLHVYKSKKWRKCFESLNSTISSNAVEKKDEGDNAASGPIHEKKEQEAVPNTSTSSVSGSGKAPSVAVEPLSSPVSPTESKGEKQTLLDVLSQDESSNPTSTPPLNESRKGLSVGAQKGSLNTTSTSPIDESVKDSSVDVEPIAPPTKSEGEKETLRSIFFDKEA